MEVNDHTMNLYCFNCWDKKRPDDPKLKPPTTFNDTTQDRCYMKASSAGWLKYRGKWYCPDCTGKGPSPAVLARASRHRKTIDRLASERKERDEHPTAH